MEKAHSRIKWENYPSIATPLNETNLNKMDIALDEVDNRVLGLDTAKLDKAVANTMVKDIAFNEKTGIFTITLLDGTTKTIDTKLEKVATNFSYDYETQKLVLTLVDGTEQEIDMSTLISQYEFADTSTIGFTVGNEGKITAIVKDGSVTEAKLQPNFLANVKTEVSKAKSYADSSYENATTSRNAVTEAKQYRDEALQFRNEAESFAPEGYADIVEQVNENTVKVDTIIAKADLGIKETATGEEIHLTDSAEGKAVEFALYGKAKQNQYSGNQLFDVNDKMSVNSRYSVDEYGWISASYDNTNGSSDIYLNYFTNPSFALKPNTNYVIVAEVESINNCRLDFVSNHSTNNPSQFTALLTAVGKGIHVATALTKESFDTSKCMIRTVVTINSGVSASIKFRISVLEDTSVTADTFVYEPFVGGIPSPNPQYPQPIEVSGASGSVVVKSCGSQLFDGTTVNASIGGNNTTTLSSNATCITAIIECKPNTTYTISKNVKTGRFVIGDYYEYPQLGVTDINVLVNPGINPTNTDAIITTSKNAKYLLVYYTNQSEECDIMVNKGTTPLPYEPYKETLATIPTENGLASVNDLRDAIIKYADGSGEKIKNTHYLEVTEEKIQNTFYEETYKRLQVAIPLPDIAEFIPSSQPIGYCNFAKVLSGGTVNATYKNSIILRKNGTYLTVYVWADGVTNKESFLALNPKFLFGLSTPITTPLTAEEIAEIEKLQTFYPITNISNDFDCGMKVKYNCDSKNYIDNKIALLTTAMVNSI